MLGSLAGRIAPPGWPKTTSTPSSSRDLMTAAAPVISMGPPSAWGGAWVRVVVVLGRETKRPPARRAERSRAWGGRAGQPRRDCATTPRSRARVPTRAACDARGTHDADAADGADDADGAHDADGPEGAVRWIDVIGLAPPGYPSGYPCSGRVPVSAGDQ